LKNNQIIIHVNRPGRGAKEEHMLMPLKNG